MDSIFTIIVIILLALAVSGLVVGVANDAVNFLNSALGSKAAPRYVILIVASVGIIIGALTSKWCFLPLRVYILRSHDAVPRSNVRKCATPRFIQHVRTPNLNHRLSRIRIIGCSNGRFDSKDRC